MDVEVPEHFIRAPAADEADDVEVDAGQEECCHSSGGKTARRDLGRKETEVWPAGGNSVADLNCEVRSRNLVGGVENPRQGGSRRSRMFSEVKHTADDGLDRA